LIDQPAAAEGGATEPRRPAQPGTGPAARRPGSCPHLGRADDPATAYLHPHAGHRCHAVVPADPVTVDVQGQLCYADYEACPRYLAFAAAGAPVPAEEGADVAVVAGGGAAKAANEGAKEGAKEGGFETRPYTDGTGLSVPESSRPTDPASADTAGQGPGRAPHAGVGVGAGFKPALPGGPNPARLAADPDPTDASSSSAPPASSTAATRARAWAGRRSMEDWLALGGFVFVALAVAYGGLAAPSAADRAAGPVAGALPPTEAALLAALEATPTPTPPPPPTPTLRPTRPADAALVATAPPPPAPEGGLVAALAPVERGVGSFGQAARLPSVGQRELGVGWFGGEPMLGGLLIPLTKLPPGADLASAQLELAGLSVDNLGSDGTWTVEMLAPAAAEAWSDLTFDGLTSAQADGPSWVLPAAELATGHVNALPFDDAALQALAARLPEGRVAFRIRGPAGPPDGADAEDSPDDLFVWDTGFGGGFGTRPVLRVGFVPPPPTPGPAPGEPTALPLVVWFDQTTPPTPTPTATPLPASLPEALVGRILFLSDRFGEPRLMVYDPAADRLGQVTQAWTYQAARAADTSAAGASVRVAEVPCGSGGDTIKDADGRPMPNPDPARRCAQVVLAGGALQPPGAEREVTESGWVHYDPALAPDGRWVAYVSQVTGTDEVFRVGADGTGNQRLTENAWAWDKHPSISPDGARIVFWSNRDGRKQLFVMDADGGNQAPLAPSPFNDWDPVWVK